VVFFDGEGGAIMANMIRRENRDVSRGSAPEHRVDPFRVLDALLRWDPLRSDLSGVAQGSDFVPRFDVKETKDAYVIKVDLPGVKDEDVDVSLNGNLLAITGKKEEEHREEGEQYYAMERSYGSFARTFALPDSVDGEHVTAELRNGVLTVQIPKKPEAQPKKIAIGKAGSEGKAKA
jgi:HSP20 family protein